MSALPGDRAAFAAARDVLRERRGRAGSTDLAYAAYLAIMLAIIVVAPVVRAAVLGTADGLAGLGEAVAVAGTAAELLAGALAALTGLLALGGAHTGPAHARLADVDMLLSGPFPRARVLGGATARVFAAAAVLGAGAGALLAGAWAVLGRLDPESCIALLLAGASLGLLAVAAMLAGQIARGLRAGIAAVLAALAVLHALSASGALAVGTVPGPWAAFAATAFAPTSAAPRGGGGMLAAEVWFALALILLAAVPWLLGRLRRSTLREQSLSWSAVSALALTGDLRMAVERLGAPVRMGRRLRWRAPGRVGAAVAMRDLIGIVRTPGRSLAALCGVVGAGALLGSAPPWLLGPLWAGVVGAAGLVLVYASIGPWCRGLRAAAQTLGGLPLLPSTPGGLLSRHAAVPGLLATCLGALAAGATTAIGGGDPWQAAAFAVATGLFGLLLRVLGALKGPLPQRLLTPVPTPAGDMAGLNVLLWSLDGIFWAVLVGAVLGALSSVSVAAAAAGCAVLVAAFGAGIAARLRRGSRVG